MRIHQLSRTGRTALRWCAVGAVLVATMLLTAACGSDDDAGDADEQASNADTQLDSWFAEVKREYGGTTLKLAMAAHPATEAFQELTGEFESKTGIKVVYDVMEEGQLGEKELLECQRKSSGYDGYMTAAENATGSLALKCNLPLDDYLDDPELTPDWYDKDDLIPAYLDLFDVDGGIAAMPFAGETVFLMYRKDLLEAAGKPVPKTWDELRETAKALTKGSVAGVSFRAASGWEFTYEWSVFLFPFGGRIVDPDTGEAALDVPGSVAALEYMKSLKPYAPKGIESFSFSEAWSAMQTGRVAMAVEASAGASQMEDKEKSAVAGKIGYAPLPAGPDGAYSGAWAWGLGINYYSKNAEAMWALLAYLTGKPTHKRYVDLGGPATRSSVFNDPAYRSKYPYFEATEQALAQAGDLAKKGLGVVPKTAAWLQMSDIIGREGSKAFVDQQSSQDAVTKMQTQVADLLAKADS